MILTFRNFLIIVLFSILLSNPAKAQPRTGRFIDVSVGLAVTVPDDNIDVVGRGFSAQGEYVFGLSRWIGIRPYAGIILTSADKYREYEKDYKVTSKAFLVGGKARICAPIPWVAPYFETGIGASIGSFETYTSLTDQKKNGILMHIPLSMGLAIGRKHNFDFGVTYYFTPSAEQASGGWIFGFTFPLQ